jgi:mannosyltransferase OCH1-like enzyme
MRNFEDNVSQTPIMLRLFSIHPTLPSAAEGGIYLDWDVIVTRSFDSLLHNGVVFGAEKKVAPYQLGLGVAVMMSRPREPFMVRYNELMGKYFEPSKCYACHTIQVRPLSVR